MRKFISFLIGALLVLACGAALAEAVPVKLSDNGIVCDDKGVIVDGSKVTFMLPAEYEITGSLSNGQLVIDCEFDGEVTLILSNVTIHNETGAAIFVKQCSPRASIMLAEGTVNELSGGEKYTLDANDEPNGVIFSKDDITIKGAGALNVTAKYMDGIVSKDDIRIKGGIITVKAPRNGIRGKDSVEIFDGTIDITAGNDGIKSTNEKEDTKGFVAISGGTITIKCVDDPISVITRLTITGGSIDSTIVKE